MNRLLGFTPEPIKQRMKLWESLLNLGKTGGVRARLKEPNQSIFKGSRIQWDLLDGLGNVDFSLPRRRTARAEAKYTSRFGPLVQKSWIEQYDCDATDLHGICNSKAEDFMHASIDDLGAYFIDSENRLNRQGKPPLGIDHASLREMLMHHEIRLLHAPGHDSLSVRAWDGRLFADNAGGSHHLSAAVHVARRLGEKIPLTSRLYLYKLNAQTVHWLLNSMHMVLVHSSEAISLNEITRHLLGSATCGPMPAVICEAHLLAFPKGTTLAAMIMQELLAADFQDFGAELATHLGKQEHFFRYPPTGLGLPLAHEWDVNRSGESCHQTT